MTFWERQSRTGQPRRLLCFSAAFCLPCLIFALAYSRGWPLPLCWPVGAAFCVALPLWICKRRRAAASLQILPQFAPQLRGIGTWRELARGRKAYDKREYLKENDAKREMDKAMKRYK